MLGLVHGWALTLNKFLREKKITKIDFNKENKESKLIFFYSFEL